MTDRTPADRPGRQPDRLQTPQEAECLFRGLKRYRRIVSRFETLDAMYRTSLNADMNKASRTQHKKFHFSGNIQPLEGC